MILLAAMSVLTSLASGQLAELVGCGAWRSVDDDPRKQKSSVSLVDQFSIWSIVTLPSCLIRPVQVPAQLNIRMIQ